MGYCTSYRLSVIEGENTIYEVLEEEGQFEGLEYAIDENGEPICQVKWYTHEEDMRELSQKFPELVFELKGEGEEAGDLWIKYFKNGKMQNAPAMIVFDDFNEELLS